MGLTYAVPLYERANPSTLSGVLSADCGDLEELNTWMQEEVKFGKSGQGFIVDRQSG